MSNERVKQDSSLTGMLSSRSTIKNVENILIMQGGGSLGAFGCGVFKGLMKRNIRIDVAAGTSIGAVNAAIIVGSKSGHPEIDLEEFWLEIAESSPSIIPDIFLLDYDKDARTHVPKTRSSAAANAALFGVPKMFVPRWLMWNSTPVHKDKEDLLDPVSWTYLYDHSPLAKTLDKYIDYKKLNLAATLKEEEKPEVLRLIMTAVNVMTAKPLIFDNTKMEIKAKHILASAGYPLYGFHWIEVQDGIYAWDGSLLSNTPIREVIYSSPRNDKNIIIVENYPQKIERLPSNMMEVQSRARDILFCDKEIDDIKMSKFITRQIQLIQRLYDVFERFEQDSGYQPSEIARIKSEYNTLIQKYGARILSVTRIIRSEIESPTVLKNANFSPRAVKELMAQGETKAIEKIDKLTEEDSDSRTVI